MIDVVSVFGLMGAITAAGLFYPQVWKSYRTRRTNDVSWLGVVFWMLDGIIWIIYGLLRSDPFIYVTNIALFIGAFLMMVLKKRYG
jgi:MtN3 and saliva related transmembrane protein